MITAPQMAMTEPTERSIPFVPITTAMPSATTAVGMAAVQNIDQAAEQSAFDDPDGEETGRNEAVDDQDQRQGQQRPNRPMARGAS